MGKCILDKVIYIMRSVQRRNAISYTNHNQGIQQLFSSPRRDEKSSNQVLNHISQSTKTFNPLPSIVFLRLRPSAIEARTPAAANANLVIGLLTILVLVLALARGAAVAILVSALRLALAALRIHLDARVVLHLARILAALRDRRTRVRTARFGILARVELEWVAAPVRG